MQTFLQFVMLKVTSVKAYGGKKNLDFCIIVHFFLQILKERNLKTSNGHRIKSVHDAEFLDHYHITLSTKFSTYVFTSSDICYEKAH